MALCVAILFVVVLAGVLWLVLHEEQARRQATTPQGTLEALWRGGAERRQHPRAEISCVVKYRVLPAMPTAEARDMTRGTVGRLHDASPGGMAARLPERLIPGLLLECEIIPRRRKPIFARGEVRWTKEIRRIHLTKRREFLTGIQFRDITPEHMARLHMHIRQATPRRRS